MLPGVDSTYDRAAVICSPFPKSCGSDILGNPGAKAVNEEMEKNPASSSKVAVGHVAFWLLLACIFGLLIESTE